MADISTITIPLKTEKWQEDALFKRFEACRSIYNAMLGYELKQYRKMKREKEYKEAIETIHSFYKEENETEKEKIRSSEAYKKAQETQRNYMREYGFSNFSFGSTAIRFSKHFSSIVPSKVAQMSVGFPMWTAFEKLFFGNGEKIYFKKYDKFPSVVSDGSSGIRMVGESGKMTRKLDSRQKNCCIYSTRESKSIMMPLKIDRKDKYLLEMMERDIHTVRITRKKVKDKYKYYVQLAVSGNPAIKYDKDGKELHSVGREKLGIYIDTTSITIALKDKVEIIDIRRNNIIEEEVAKTERFLDTSRRLSNPENFNDDGTIKKGIIKDGQRHPLKWNYSNNYRKAKAHRANLSRVDSEQRKIDANSIANRIMEMGCEITINDYPFQTAAMRRKFKEGEETDEKGRSKKKKKAGKTIGENAPAMIVKILDSKLKARGYEGVKKVKLENVDYSIEDYRKYYAQELYSK